MKKNRFKLKRWEKKENYRGEDLSQYFILLTKTRDSGILKKSNFDVAKKRLEGLKGVRIDRFNHWAVGWIKQILIKQGSEKALIEAEEIISELNNYPVLDEEDYNERMTD